MYRILKTRKYKWKLPSRKWNMHKQITPLSPLPLSLNMKKGIWHIKENEKDKCQKTSPRTQRKPMPTNLFPKTVLSNKDFISFSKSKTKQEMESKNTNAETSIPFSLILVCLPWSVVFCCVEEEFCFRCILIWLGQLVHGWWWNTVHIMMTKAKAIGEKREGTPYKIKVHTFAVNFVHQKAHFDSFGLTNQFSTHSNSIQLTSTP